LPEEQLAHLHVTLISVGLSGGVFSKSDSLVISRLPSIVSEYGPDGRFSCDDSSLKVIVVDLVKYRMMPVSGCEMSTPGNWNTTSASVSSTSKSCPLRKPNNPSALKTRKEELVKLSPVITNRNKGASNWLRNSWSARYVITLKTTLLGPGEKIVYKIPVSEETLLSWKKSRKFVPISCVTEIDKSMPGDTSTKSIDLDFSILFLGWLNVRTG
jgi:hypothetical protein